MSDPNSAEFLIAVVLWGDDPPEASDPLWAQTCDSARRVSAALADAGLLVQPSTGPRTWSLPAEPGPEVTAVLDERERIAKAAGMGGEEWDYHCVSLHMDGKSSGPITTVGVSRPAIAHAGTNYAGPHIALHDPADALRRYAAARRVLAAYEHARLSMATYPNNGNAASLVAWTMAVEILAESLGISTDTWTQT